ncbi:uncharacterized protein METZ01_LOCUS175981 [marine metagenome]|uniref:Uncharacterized protein n=1 Tax=marine metagenome TaxID=408172 RepID=A0A382CCQ5_9ZZZZ
MIMMKNRFLKNKQDLYLYKMSMVEIVFIF